MGCSRKSRVTAVAARRCLAGEHLSLRLHGEVSEPSPTETPQVRASMKITTRSPQTKLHTAALSGTTAKMGVSKFHQALCL